eukprot:81374-Amphidinium_carterae.1
MQVLAHGRKREIVVYSLPLSLAFLTHRDSFWMGLPRSSPRAEDQDRLTVAPRSAGQRQS